LDKVTVLYKGKGKAPAARAVIREKGKGKREKVERQKTAEKRRKEDGFSFLLFLSVPDSYNAARILFRICASPPGLSSRPATLQSRLPSKLPAPVCAVMSSTTRLRSTCKPRTFSDRGPRSRCRMLQVAFATAAAPETLWRTLVTTPLAVVSVPLTRPTAVSCPFWLTNL